MKLIKKAASLEQRGATYILHADQADFLILFMSEHVVRIRCSYDRKFRECSYSLVTTAWKDETDDLMKEERRQIEPYHASMTEEETGWVLATSAITLSIRKEPFQMIIRNANGEIIHKDLPENAWYQDRNRRGIHSTMIFDNDRFYGFGEKTGTLNKYHTFMTMNPGDAMGYDPVNTDSLYKNIPFYIRMNGKTRTADGYFYQNAGISDFDIGKSRSNYMPFGTRYRVESGDVDLFFIEGPSINEVIERYTDLTGKSMMLPSWSLGYLASSMYYSELPSNCDASIETFIDTCHKEEIPVDGFQLSSGYCEENGKRYVFTFNKERFHDPQDFFAKMEEKGVTVSPNVKPGFLLNHPLMDQLRKEDIFVKDPAGEAPAVGIWWGGHGMLADFTNPHTREVWQALLQEHLLKYGVTSIWNDNCEYESIFDSDSQICLEGNPGALAEYRSAMANIMCRITNDELKHQDSSLRPLVVCRAGGAGIQRYAETWAGDNYTSWDTLKYNIATILGMGMSGVSNEGADVGGFYGPAPEPELFVRWVQMGIFEARFSIHSTNTDNTVTEPWMYPAYTSCIRNAIQLRYRLFPYFYSLMHRANVSGLPILQAMVSVFQNDPALDEEGIDFMVGDSLMAACVVEKGASTRHIYFPAGNRFYDLSTSQLYEGGTSIDLPVAMDSIPLFLRDGGIISLSKKQLMNLHHAKVTNLELLAADGRDGSFDYYEDDGMTNSCRKGSYALTKIRMHKETEKTVFQFTSEGSMPSNAESILLKVFHDGSAPYHVLMQKEYLKQYLYKPEFEEAECGWYYDPQAKTVQVKFARTSGDFDITVDYGNFNLLGM